MTSGLKSSAKTHLTSSSSTIEEEELDEEELDEEEL
jgi:hypothetical protein